MLLRLVCATALVLAVSACRTTEEDSSASVKGIPDGAQGLPILPTTSMKLLASLENEAAQGMYDALNAEEQLDQVGGRKSYQGDVSIFCERSGGGGQIPPGAQGIVAPANFSCAINSRAGVNFPDGAQGLPPPPVLILDGDNARAFYTAFNVPNQGNRKQFQGNVDIGCQYSDVDGARSGYNCQVRGEVAGGDDQPQGNRTILSLAGGDAKQLFDKLSIQTVQNAKQRSGDLAVTCQQKGFGGQIPPGAQGIVAPATFDCRFVAPSSLPPGAQGIPGPAKVLAKFKGNLARSVFNALQLDAQDIQGGLSKDFNDDATLRCGWVKVNGKKKYDCSVTTGTGGGIPDGAQGLPIPQGN